MPKRKSSPEKVFGTHSHREKLLEMCYILIEGLSAGPNSYDPERRLLGDCSENLIGRFMMGSIDDIHDAVVGKVSRKTNQNWSDVSDEFFKDPADFAYKYKEHLTKTEYEFLAGPQI